MKKNWTWWCSNELITLYETLCAIWYHLYSLKNVKITHGGVLLLVKLQESCKLAYKFGCFSRFVKLYKWYQIAQRTTYISIPQYGTYIKLFYFLWLDNFVMCHRIHFHVSSVLKSFTFIVSFSKKSQKYKNFLYARVRNNVFSFSSFREITNNYV